MMAGLDLSLLPKPLSAVFQSVVVERDCFRVEREQSHTEQRRLECGNKWLKETMRLLRVAKYGPKSEKLSDAQLDLLEAEPGATREEVVTEAAQPQREKRLKPRAPHGRAPLRAHLPRWNPAHKAVVLDGNNCRWSKHITGLSSVVRADNRLAIFYDGQSAAQIPPGVKSHMNRDIGLAWLALPLVPPAGR